MNTQIDRDLLASAILAREESEVEIDAWNLDEVDLGGLGSPRSALAGSDEPSV